MSLPDPDSLNYTVTVLGILGILVGWWRGWFESPKRRSQRAQDKAVADAILGEPPVKDRNEKVITPGQPGLVHRVAQVEEAVVEFRHVIALYTETQKRLDIHDRAINALIAGSLERAATAMSSAAMWTAVHNKDVIDAASEED